MSLPLAILPTFVVPIVIVSHVLLFIAGPVSSRDDECRAHSAPSSAFARTMRGTGWRIWNADTRSTCVTIRRGRIGSGC